MKNSPLEMIAEWRKGCSVAQIAGQPPEYCPECTLALINALEKALSESCLDWSTNVKRTRMFRMKAGG